MPVLARIIFRYMEWASRRGFAPVPDLASSPGGMETPRAVRRRTGVRGETFAYWYLRRHGYTIIARNFTVPGVKGEIDLIGYDGTVLAFIEVKTRTGEPGRLGLPEDAVTPISGVTFPAWPANFAPNGACVSVPIASTSSPSNHRPAPHRPSACTKELSLSSPPPLPAKAANAYGARVHVPLS